MSDFEAVLDSIGTWSYMCSEPDCDNKSKHRLPYTDVMLPCCDEHLESTKRWILGDPWNTKKGDKNVNQSCK